MSAEELGGRLLGEVKEETLDELLLDLRSPNEPHPKSHSGIELLDRLLNAFLYPSAPEQSTRSRWDSPDPNDELTQGPVQVPTKSAIPKNPIIEITSPSSAGGKTHLLYYIAAVAVLPSTYHAINLRGRGSAVVFLDTDGRFEALRLHQITKSLIQEHARAQSTNITWDDLDALVASCLGHVHVCRPQSSRSLLTTLQNIELYLLRGIGHFSSGRSLGAILIDSASAFYWQDRLDADMARLGPTGEDHGANRDTDDASTSSDPRETSQEIVKSLRHLQHTFSCPLIYTTWGLSPVLQRIGDSYVLAKPLSFRPQFPYPWSPTLRLVVNTHEVARFGPDMSIEEAKRDKEKRQMVVEQGAFSGWVDRWGSEGWSGRVWEGLTKVEGKGWFGFWIKRERVGMEGNQGVEE